MRASKLEQWDRPGKYVQVLKPVPGYGECLIEMKAAGLCLGEEAVVHHLKHCGICNFCTSGAEQHCEAYKRGDVVLTRGAGLDGGLAEYLVVPRHELVSIGDQDPGLYAPLTDAGVAVYHAVQSLAQLDYGKHWHWRADKVVLSDAPTGPKLLDMTNGNGIDYIVDFVGSGQTLALAAKFSRPQGRILGWNHMATSCEFALSIGSTRQDLEDVCRLAAAGKLRINMQNFSFDQIQEAHDSLRAGRLSGRAVIVF
ncbi:GroES-like protein [Aureobasidium melanogenum CBS 110374]|uniref:GroES-like protein n=1 Tax=Aureobasidium melanogenum (strain CBS 110374) TaxID=1043003 RepID=A0A074VTF0_AURM1|nr:GroES-like protein [Aureobasidium melanogenum CBS 110374]KEQ63693.1 GroES-like protein [Aureobasidium melanogenum CBS 110374]